MTSKCFISDIHRDTFAKHNLSFSMHRERDQNQWNYSYFLMGLLIKDEEEMNGVESYVLERYRKKELSWLPVGRALSLQAFDTEKGIEEKVDNIDMIVDNLESSLEEIGISADELNFDA